MEQELFFKVLMEVVVVVHQVVEVVVHLKLVLMLQEVLRDLVVMVYLLQ
jgi:hypothetical protein